jgi:hypothetical protein
MHRDNFSVARILLLYVDQVWRTDKVGEAYHYRLEPRVNESGREALIPI